MDSLQVLLVGYALGVAPASKTGQIVVAYLGKRLGVKPGQIERYDSATETGENDG